MVVVRLLVACQGSLGIVPVLLVGCQVSLPVLVPRQLSLQLYSHTPFSRLDFRVHTQLILLRPLACKPLIVISYITLRAELALCLPFKPRMVPKGSSL